MPVLAPLYYNPPVSYFAALVNQKELLLEAEENYQKQTYRNRCHILTDQGVKPLIIPVQHTVAKIPVQEVKIDNSQRWAGIHWRTIRSAYGSAPYFIYYADHIESIYLRKPEHLFSLNLELLKVYIKLLQLDISVTFTSEFRTNYPTTIVDRRNLVHPKRKADNLIAEPYVQVFGRRFVPDLSILDLLFNLGPEAHEYLVTIAPGLEQMGPEAC